MSSGVDATGLLREKQCGVKNIVLSEKNKNILGKAIRIRMFCTKLQFYRSWSKTEKEEKLLFTLNKKFFLVLET